MGRLRQCLCRLRCGHGRMGLHLDGDLRRRSRQSSWRRRCEPVCGPVLQHYASHCHGRLVYLSAWLFLRLLDGAVNDDVLNLVYNLADFVNKIAFCLAIWSCAKSSTMESANKQGALLG